MYVAKQARNEETRRRNMRVRNCQRSRFGFVARQLCRHHRNIYGRIEIWPPLAILARSPRDKFINLASRGMKKRWTRGVRQVRKLSKGGRVATPSTLPLDPPLPEYQSTDIVKNSQYCDGSGNWVSVHLFKQRNSKVKLSGTSIINQNPFAIVLTECFTVR